MQPVGNLGTFPILSTPSPPPPRPFSINFRTSTRRSCEELEKNFLPAPQLARFRSPAQRRDHGVASEPVARRVVANLLLLEARREVAVMQFHHPRIGVPQVFGTDLHLHTVHD